MSVIGDTEPEDAYDATDRLEERIAVIVRILAARDADGDREHRARRTIELLRLLDNIRGELAGWHTYVDDLAERAELG